MSTSTLSSNKNATKDLPDSSSQGIKEPVENNKILNQQYISQISKGNISNDEKTLKARLTEIDNALVKGLIPFKIWQILIIVILSILFGPNLTRTKFGGPPQLLLYSLGMIYIYLQYFMSLYAMYKKSLRVANYALRIVMINTFIGIGITLFFVYKVFERNYNREFPSDGSNTMDALFVIFLVAAAGITFTHIIFTLIGNIKVRNLLIERTNIQGKLENKEDLNK